MSYPKLLCDEKELYVKMFMDEIRLRNRMGEPYENMTAMLGDIRKESGCDVGDALEIGKIIVSTKSNQLEEIGYTVTKNNGFYMGRPS